MGKRRGSGSGATVGVGAVVVMVAVCCAVPTLLAGGVLGVIGGFFGNWLVIAAGVTVAGGGLLILFVRWARGGQVCRAPVEPTEASGPDGDAR